MEQQGRLRTLLDNQIYLDTYLPLPSHSSLPERILDPIEKAGMYNSGTWVAIPQTTKEEDIYEGFVTVLERVRALAEESLPNLRRIPGKWVDTHNAAVQTWSQSGVPGLKPDISFVHNETGNAEYALWSRVYSIIEVKANAAGTDTATLATQLGSYVGHMFAEQVDRLFVNALTLCGRQLRILRYDRSGLVVLRDAIDIDKEPLKFVQIIASFSYLPPDGLGWDPTCMVWNTEQQRAQPSYELPQKVFQQRGVYDLPWVLRVEQEDYVAIGPVRGNRSLSIWGRDTFVVHAVELEDWKNRNGQAKVYVLKQCWQRLPGLCSSPKTAEMRNGDNYVPDQADWDSVVGEFGDIDGKPFEALAMERAGWMERIKASWNVELNGEPITTFKTIRKNLATSITPPSSRKNTACTGTPRSTTWGSSRTPGPLQTIDDAPEHPALVTRRLVRLVFNRPGWPIERFKSKSELLSALKAIVTELEMLYENGVVHRDVSPSNLIISDSGGHVIDYDHSTIGFVTGEAVLEKTRTQDVTEIAKKLFEDARSARLYIRALNELWGIEDRPATRKDFGWPEEIGPVYLFGNRRPGDGFITGTYEFVSDNLPHAPSHNGVHDLDSLWWSTNVLALTLAGPGGKKREDPPRKVIDTYYSGGPVNKKELMMDLLIGGKQLNRMMAEYADYFKDLKPFMTKWAFFLRIGLGVTAYEHYHPHRYLIKIIDEAIQEMKGKAETGYEKAAKAEEDRREQEKVDMAEAIHKQMSIPMLLKLKLKGVMPSPVEAASGDLLPDMAASGSSTTNTPLSPERSPISLTTVDSPERDRAVKKARSGAYMRNTRGPAK